MPLSTTGKLITVAAMTAGVMSLSYAASRSQKEKRKPGVRRPPEEESPLEGVFSLGTRIPERVGDDIELPVNLSTEPRTVTLQGDIVKGPSMIEGEAQLANLVTDITQERANIAYEYMLLLVGTEGYDLSNETARDEAVKRTASVIAPRADWSQGLVEAFDSPKGRVWVGIQLLGELAYQSFWNKQARA